ncbi:MAG: hypothetical protein Q9183_007640 [Haloplaca sp. 2 TL-2023]
MRDHCSDVCKGDDQNYPIGDVVDVLDRSGEDRRIRYVCQASHPQKPKLQKVDEEKCIAGFEAVLDGCIDYGGTIELDGVKFKLYAFEPGPDDPPET